MTTNTSEMIRVAIIDDHPMVREGLRNFLQLSADIQVVAEAGTGEEALELAASMPLDVILMDLVMPGQYDGIAAIREITQRSPSINIIALTSFQEADRTLGAIQAGATSYLQKDVSPDDLLSAIRHAAAGRTVLDPHAYLALRGHQVSSERMSVSERPSSQSARNTREGYVEALTLREQEVLEALSTGMSNKEIANQLNISEKTVKVHISHILSKLNVYDRTQAILTASRLGLIHIQ